LSKFQVLELTAKELIESGADFNQLCNEFVDVPRHKLRDWYRSYAKDLPKITALPSTQTDTEWVKSSAKQIFAEEFDNALKLRALETIIKVIALEQKTATETPKEIPLSAQLANMTDDELNQTFRDMLS
jgi:hypothetical protein